MFKTIKKFGPAVLASAIGLCLSACSGFATDTCSDVTTGKNKLAKAQKEIGGFKKGNTAHYVHSDGFEFDLTVTTDTNYFATYRNFCIEIDKEVQKRVLTSTDPALSVEVVLEADGEHHSTLAFSYGGTDYKFNVDSTQMFDEKNHVELLDTITFNGVTYDSVYAVICNSHFYYYDNDTREYNVPTTPLTHLYFSFKKGILKFETEDGKEFTIKEGDEKD